MNTDFLAISNTYFINISDSASRQSSTKIYVSLQSHIRDTKLEDFSVWFNLYILAFSYPFGYVQRALLEKEQNIRPAKDICGLFRFGVDVSAWVKQTLEQSFFASLWIYFIEWENIQDIIATEQFFFRTGERVYRITLASWHGLNRRTFHIIN